MHREESEMRVLGTRFLAATISLFALAGLCAGQSFEDRFKAAFEDGNLELQRKVLKEWEPAEPNNPEFYISAFNHFLSRSRQEALSISRDGDKDAVVELKDEKSGKTAGYLSSRIIYDPKTLNVALGYLTEGIRRFPDRLDMRFGQIYVVNETEDFGQSVKLIVATLNRSNENKNKWKWKKGENLENPQEFLLDNIQAYLGKIFNESPDPGVFIREVAAAALKYYPEDVRYLSNLAVSHMLSEEWDAALVPLLKAHQIAPTDYVVIGNVAYSYFEKGDKKNAIKFYRLLKQHGNEAARSQADEKLRELGETP